MNIIISVKEGKDINEVASNLRRINPDIPDLQITIMKNLSNLVISFPDTISFEEARERLSLCKEIGDVCEDFELKLADEQ